MSSQLQVSGEAKIRDIQGPVVANSGVITALDGAASQYVRGDGTLADFPTSSGGGSSVSYYLNSSVSQGTIGGVAYRELNKEPIIGAGTDIAIAANGYVASYLTDANDPDVLSIPGGNFNCEFYFSVSNDTGNPFFYAELYKYDGTTFTLLGSSVGVPEYINQGTIIAPYYFAIPVATAALALTDRLAIRIYVNVDGRTVTLHTENGHLCQVVTTLSKGMVSLNNLTDQSQFITTGTTGTDFNIVSSGDTHTFNLPIASATNTGKLSSTDWSTFNNKQAALSFTAPLNNTSNTISIPAATSLVDGYLDNLDWTNFNTAYNNMIVSAAVTGTTTKTLTLTQQDAGTITASWTDDNTDAVTSVFGRTGAVVATSGDYNTSQVTELTNLYFTDARSRASLSGGTGITYNNTTGVITNSAPDQTVSLTAGAGISISGTYPSFTIASTITQYTDALARAALSFVAGSGAYNSTTGVITIPTNNNQITNGSNFITLTSLSAGAGISYNNTTGAISSTITQYTDALARAAISLTTTGTSGAATYNSTTGVFNIPNYAPDLSGYVPTSRTITINGTSFDLSANRTYSVGTVTSVGLSSATSGVTIGSTPITTSGSITLAIATASGSQNGLLSSTDWTTFNNKQSALTNPVTGTGTTNYLPKFTGASTIGNSSIFDNGSNVGVGTASPNASYRATISGAASGVIGGLAIVDTDGASYSIYSATNNLIVRDVTNSATRMTLDASGNLGLGVTPSAWGSNARALEYYAGSVNGCVVGFDDGSFQFGNNIYNNGGWLYKANGAASNYFQIDGRHVWRIAPSGTAGNAITFTQAMTLASTGNLLVGTTTDAGFKLDVYGQARIYQPATNSVNYLNIYNNRSRNAAVLTETTNGGFYAGTSIGTDTFCYQIYDGNAGSARLTIASTGAATFSSSVTAGGDLFLSLSTASIVFNSAANFNTQIYHSSGSLVFYTGANERARITSGGKVNINNTSNTNYQLYVDGGSSPAFAAYSTSANNQFKLAGTAPGLTISNTITSPTIGGALGACTSANDFITGTAAGDMILINQYTGNKLYITNYSGGVYLTQGATSWTANSDIRIKNINSHITNAVEKLSTLQTINFCYKDDISKKENLGLIAQEVEMVFPELIETNNDGILGVRYTELIPVLIEAIKEQQEQIKELKLELDKIKNK